MRKSVHVIVLLTLVFCLTLPSFESVAAPPGRGSIEFGLEFLGSYADPEAKIPNAKDWQTAVDAFTSHDPDIEDIHLHASPHIDLKSNASSYDCFYMPAGLFAESQELEDSGLLSLDSFNKANPNFHAQDFIGTSLSQVKANGKIWGIPATLSPIAIVYDTGMFGDGSQVPSVDLNAPRFENMLKTIKGLVPVAPDSYLLILIAAYGGLPLDYRTNPPKVNFTDPTTIKAIQKVLDFSKQDHSILYFQLYSEQGGGAGASDMPAYIVELEGLTGLPVLEYNGQGNLPTGVYSAVSYDVGSLYISAKTAYPEACYRWLMTILQHPKLFTGMPALSSKLDNPDLLASQGIRTVSFYKSYRRIANLPATIYIPPVDPMRVSQPFRQWLDEAFDAYVLRNENLESALKIAQDYATQYQTCLAASGIDKADPQTVNTKSQECLKQIDPRKVRS